jgi:DNA-binding CsgD family transcriptional regulator
MDAALAELRRWGGEQSPNAPLVHGLGRAFCALLEEHQGRARLELDRALALEDANPTIFHLAGRHGLHLLLRALAGEANRQDHEAVAAEPSCRLRWNRQFVLLAHAVLLGRSGQTQEAMAAVAQSQRAAAPYAMAGHLGRRLVGEAMLADGWGTPVGWLQSAEEYFHRERISAVAAACRTLLRRAGVRVRQRRDGADGIPPALRSAGVTVREYEIFRLLVDRLSNRTIAQRLHISPRTVEKHVASLMAKVGRPDRNALSEHAATLLLD